jgi:alkanesulfonate monooxygenase SsuD/methylene tetrahydromethanopterin reductase-like flavin-dependent oxidoreductase (luciferase family)
MPMREAGKAAINVVTGIFSSKQVVAFAQAAEAVGLNRVGVTDTAPRHYHAVYPAVTAALLGTKRISVGTYVTNPVTRHWSVQGATARGLDELAPGRFFLGIGTGDGAVHDVGLKPATLAHFESYVQAMRPLMPEAVDIHMVFSGPKGVEVAGRLATEVTIGTGLDAGALRTLAARARAARTAAGVTAPLRISTSVTVHIADSPTEVPALRRSVRAYANGVGRLAFDFSFEGKNVPEAYQPVLRAGLARYDHAYHGLPGDHPNARLFEDHPEIQEYLLDRMVLVGTREQCARRLEQLIAEAGLDGIWLAHTERGLEAQVAALQKTAETFRHLQPRPEV